MVFNQNGIFSRTENAVDKNEQASAREELELALSEVQMMKYEERLAGEKYENRLDNKIQEIGELLDKDTNNPNYQQVVVEGYIFLVDRSVPKIVDYVGRADGVVITASVSGNNRWLKPGEGKVTITGTIKTYSGGTITNSTATNDGNKIEDFPTTGGDYKIEVTEDTTIIITAVDSNNKDNKKTIPITIKFDNTAPTIEKVNASSTIEGEKYIIKISAEGHDKNSKGEEESGIKQFNYTISPNAGIEAKGTFKINQTIEISTIYARDYTIFVSAEDNAGNKTASVKTMVSTGGKIKHINTTTGLKEVNTLDIYGIDVKGYECERANTEWKIFYIDEEDEHRVYLISKDYMAPPTRENKLKQGNKEHLYGFNNTVLNEYKKALPEANTTTNLGKFMSKFLKEFAGVDASNRQNLQATNYMLDQEIWAEYKGRFTYIALGGPTIPLLSSAVNDIAITSRSFEYRSDSLGYEVRLGTSDSKWGSGGYVLSRSIEGKYWTAMEHKDDRMWIASPYSELTSDTQMFVLAESNYLGDMYTGSGSTGFRPIVGLNSDVKFAYNEDGTYSIVNY